MVVGQYCRNISILCWTGVGLTEVTLCIKPGHIVPVGVSTLLQLLVIRSDIWMSVVIQGTSRNRHVR